MTWATIAEAATQSSYSHEHIAWLVRNKKIAGRKSGNIWLVDIASLAEYESRMSELGPQKFDPARPDPA